MWWSFSSYNVLLLSYFSFNIANTPAHCLSCLCSAGMEQYYKEILHRLVRITYGPYVDQEDVCQLRWRLRVDLIFSPINTHEASKQEVEKLMNEWSWKHQTSKEASTKLDNCHLSVVSFLDAYFFEACSILVSFFFWTHLVYEIWLVRRLSLWDLAC